MRKQALFHVSKLEFWGLLLRGGKRFKKAEKRKRGKEKRGKGTKADKKEEEGNDETGGK